MVNKITKGMILAAGLGTRLRPLTYRTPKPLIEVGGHRIIEYGLRQFKEAGITEIIINIHHLADQIKSALGDGSKYGLKITYSYESEILGTGGGIKNVEVFFGNEPFIVGNGDVITDAALKDFIKFHIDGKTEATLMLRPLSDGENYTPLKVDGDCLVEIGSGNMMYTGLQIVNPSILELLPSNSASDIVKDAYMPALEAGRKIGAYIHRGFWTDIGTMKRLEDARSKIV